MLNTFYEMIVQPCSIIGTDGSHVLDQNCEEVNHILIPWIHREKDSGMLFNSNEWKVYHQIIDNIDCADEYLVYHKLYRFHDLYFHLAIEQTTIKQFRFILRYYGKAEKDTIVIDDFIPEKYWNFPY